MTHRHLSDGNTAGRAPAFEAGYHYHTVLFTLRTDLTMHQYSRELVFPAVTRPTSTEPSQPLRGASQSLRGVRAKAKTGKAGQRRMAYEGVQMVMSATRTGPLDAAGQLSVTLAYGVNDCESAAVTLSLDALSRLLEFEATGQTEAAYESKRAAERALVAAEKMARKRRRAAKMSRREAIQAGKTPMPLLDIPKPAWISRRGRMAYDAGRTRWAARRAGKTPLLDIPKQKLPMWHTEIPQLLAHAGKVPMDLRPGIAAKVAAMKRAAEKGQGRVGRDHAAKMKRIAARKRKKSRLCVPDKSGDGQACMHL